MSFQFANIESEYSRNKHLKKEDVKILLHWASKQPHLPPVTELIVILFLHSCYYKLEATKNTIDNYFTLKTLNPELFANKSPALPTIQMALTNSLGAVLPKQTPEGYTIIFLKLMSTNTETFNFIDHIKIFELLLLLNLYQEGTSEGHIIVADLRGSTFGHLTKVISAGPLVLKKFLIYLQETLPVRLKGLHFINIVPFMDKILALIKPLIKLELMDLLYLHNTIQDLVHFIPLECLPEDYGGFLESTTKLQEKNINRINENLEFFEWEELQRNDEKKRIEKLKNRDKIFGIDGSFKKLEID